MIHFGDVTVERSGDTFVYKRGENSLVNWTIGGDDLNEEDYEFVDNWEEGSTLFSFIAGNITVYVDMRNGVHSFQSENYTSRIESSCVPCV